IYGWRHLFWEDLGETAGPLRQHPSGLLGGPVGWIRVVQTCCAQITTVFKKQNRYNQELCGEGRPEGSFHRQTFNTKELRKNVRISLCQLVNLCKTNYFAFNRRPVMSDTVTGACTYLASDHEDELRGLL